jgi:hypothetical protein
MNGKRQNNQLLLAFEAESRSETPREATEGTAPLAAIRTAESPAITAKLMEEVLEKGISGISEISQWTIAQPAEPPYTDPYVRWCDRESE